MNFEKEKKETLLERCFNVAVPASVAPRVDYYAFDLGALKTVLSSYYLFEKWDSTLTPEKRKETPGVPVIRFIVTVQLQRRFPSRIVILTDNIGQTGPITRSTTDDSGQHNL